MVLPINFNILLCFLSYNDNCGYDGEISIPDTNLNDSSTYFTEYVLEDSNAADYFNKHVVGFSFKSRDSASDLGSIKATVWYSNMVSMTLENS